MKTLKVTKVKGVVADVMSIVRQVNLWINDATNGDYIITFDRIKRPRSNEQNRLMWVWFTCIAKSWSEATGIAFTPQNVHDAYCQLFLPVTLPSGLNIAGSTSRLTSQQFSEFLDKVQADAASNYGIRLLSPTDAFYEEWSRQYVNY